MDAKISFITFTRNSAKQLPHLLSNVKDIVDEIIVIDGFSADETVEIARSFGARVYQRKPWGYADPDRMFALRMASYEWILYLDTDERLGRRLKSVLRDLVAKTPEEVVAFSVTRVNTHKGRILLGPFYPDTQIRVFRKSRTVYKGLVHEQPIIHGRIVQLPEEYYIIHLPLEEELQRRKLVFYAKLEALEYYKRGGSRRVWRNLLKLAPFNTPLIYLFYITTPLVMGRPINSYMLLDAVKPALYDALTETLMKTRSRRQRKIARLIQEKGLIQLLGLQ
ncbi:MAG: glycosyltransferase family 2 protein [Desulfurococcus sp.]|nr:glycosyltransferase family 2 protein [Desulfurococcus sp.]